MEHLTLVGPERPLMDADRRSLTAEYVLMVAALMTVFVIAGVAALTAHHFLGPACSSLASASSQSLPVGCR
jgi:hypothetical protein